MAESMIRRKAQFAIGVYSDDVPPTVGKFRAYPNNRILCSVGNDGTETLALEVAYRLARTELCWQIQHSTDGVNQAKVEEAVKYAQEKVFKKFQGIKTKATDLKTLADEIRKELIALNLIFGRASKAFSTN